MKTGTEALSARFVDATLPESLIVPAGDAWPQPRVDVIKHPEVELLGQRRGAEWERRIADIVERARSTNAPNVTILLIAEAANTAKEPHLIAQRLLAHADSLEVVFFARRQEAAVPSWLAQRVQSWTQPDYTELSLDAVLLRARRYFRYDRIMERWSSDTFTLTPIPYFESDRANDGLIDRFTKYTGVPVPSATGAVTRNESLGKEHLEQLGAFKRRWGWARRVPLANIVAERGFYGLRKSLQRAQPAPRWKLTVKERARITEHYAESNATFKKMLGNISRRQEWKDWFGG